MVHWVLTDEGNVEGKCEKFRQENISQHQFVNSQDLFRSSCLHPYVQERYHYTGKRGD